MSDAPRTLPLHKVWRLLFWALVLAVTVLMLVPEPPRQIHTGWDKTNHLLSFACLTLAGLAAWHARGQAAVTRLCLGLLVWGAVLEGLQSMLPPRRGELADWLANALGVLLGLALFAAWRRLFSAGRR